MIKPRAILPQGYHVPLGAGAGFGGKRAVKPALGVVGAVLAHDIAEYRIDLGIRRAGVCRKGRQDRKNGKQQRAKDGDCFFGIIPHLPFCGGRLRPTLPQMP